MQLIDPLTLNTFQKLSSQDMALTTEVKERVELYLCFHSEPSQPLLGRNFATQHC
jgi:hypothetical protein